MRNISNQEYFDLANSFFMECLDSEISQLFYVIELSKEEFLFSFICASFNPLYVPYIGLKPIYNNIPNDFSRNKFLRFLSHKTDIS